MATSRHGLLPLALLVALVGPGCGDAESSSCGDGVPEVGEACLVAREASVEPFLAVGDVDGDGRTDAVVIVDRDARRVAVRRGEADGSFGPAGPGAVVTVLPSVAAVGDADGDGAAEVLLWASSSDDAGEICAHALEPGGTLDLRWCHVALEPSGSLADRLLVGALGPEGEAGFAAWTQGRTQVVVSAPDGAATEAWIDMPITSDGTAPLALADLDGDGRDALLWIAEARLEQHEAPWGAPPETIDVPESLYWAVAADYDGDGIDDVALVRAPCQGSGPLQVRLSSGAKVEVALGDVGGCAGPTAGDLDGDGQAELLFVDAQGFAVAWGHALATEETVEVVRIEGPALGSSHGLVVGDVNGDGLADPMLTTTTDVPWEGGYLPQWIAEVWVADP